MNFKSGTRCWNGPERSLSVSLLCGREEKILAVSEPEMCTYTMDFATPAACDETAALPLDVESLESGLQEAEM